MASRRQLLKHLAGAGLAANAFGSVAALQAATGSRPVGAGDPQPIFEKPEPVAFAELERLLPPGVSAVEVKDFSPCGYQGIFTPSPPHADLNPQRAILIAWKDKPHRLIFSHEASYVPWMELPGGFGLCNQFFEANRGAELFNDQGRKERNSFVDIIESGPSRAWVRWNYVCLYPNDNENPVLRGTEDYIAYPNGLVWRRLTYESLKPESPEGYSWQPIDFFCPVPANTQWADFLNRDTEHNDYFVGSVIDAYSSRRYDKFWDNSGHPRRVGDAKLLLDISQSGGLAMVVPYKAGCLFTILGASSGFPADRSQVVDHSFKDTGGSGWNAIQWDHWPVGWINSESHTREPGSPYPWHFGPFSHYIVSPPLKNASVEFEKRTEDMALNRWSERHVYYTLTGTSGDIEAIRRLARRWLDKGRGCANPASIADL